MSEAPTQDRFCGGRLTLLQPRRGHRAGTDALLLAACLTPPAGTQVLDLGAGVGGAGLALAVRATGCLVTLVEVDADVAALARRNVADNDLAERVAVIEADVLAPARQRAASGLADGMADAALCNPPFHLPGTVRVSPDAYRRRAHMLADTDEAWMRAAAALLRPGGVLALIHRADALPRVLAALAGRFGDLRIKPVLPQADAAATRILIRAIKGSRGPLALLPPLVLHEADGSFTAEAEALHQGDATIAWGMPA